MKRDKLLTFLLIFLIAGAIIMPTTSCDSEDTSPGGYSKSSPDITMLDINNKEVKLSKFYGKPVVINFWSPNCPYCLMEMPVFNEAYKDYPEVQFVMLHVPFGLDDAAANAKAYVEEKGFDFDLFFDTDGSAADAYGVSSYPTTVLIDKDGNYIAKQSGMLTKDVLEQGIKMITE